MSAERETSRLQTFSEVFVYGLISLTGASGLLLHVINSGSFRIAASSSQTHYGMLSVLLFALSWLNYRQVRRYSVSAALVDWTEAALMLICFYLLRLIPGTVTDAAPAEGYALVALAAATFVQLAWRHQVGLENTVEHYDFRFLFIAAFGFAYAAPQWWLRLFFVMISAALLLIYVSQTLQKSSRTAVVAPAAPV